MYKIGNTLQLLNKIFVIQVEIEDQLPVVGEIDEQLQDAVNVGFQEGLLADEEIAEEQWRLKDSAMAAFSTIFEGYKAINTSFMEPSKLIDGTPLNVMGHILIAIQNSAARSAGYGEGEWEDEWGVEGKGEAEEEVRWGGAERRVGREQNKRRPPTKTMTTGHAKFPKEKNNPPQKGTHLMYKKTLL